MNVRLGFTALITFNPTTEIIPVAPHATPILLRFRGDKAWLGLAALKTLSPPTEVIPLTLDTLPVIRVIGISRGFLLMALVAVYPATEVISVALPTLPVLLVHIAPCRALPQAALVTLAA